MKYDTPKNPDELQGHYANYFRIGYNAVEFVVDFGQLYSDVETARIHTRIITGPSYAIALLDLLRQSIDQYQQNFRAIDAHDEDSVQPPEE